MVSKLLVRASESDVLERRLTSHPLVRRIALRFVAGERLEDGVAAAEQLAALGRSVSLDVVGERVTDADAARLAADDYLATLAAIERHELPGGISVKPSQLGAGRDPDAALELLAEVAKEAGRVGAHLTLDMEGNATTETTVRLVEQLHDLGHAHVGCAVQSALRRTPDDIARLAQLGASLRLCKGAYAEPASVAHQRRAHVDAAYRHCATLLLERGDLPRFATHDHRLIGFVRREARRLGRQPGDHEFQLLHGVRTDVAARLVDLGERVCIYVPFGSSWYPYFVRRIAERPANLQLLVRALLSSPRRT